MCFKSSFQQGYVYAVHTFLKVFQYCSVFSLKQLLLIINAQQLVNIHGAHKRWREKIMKIQMKIQKEIHSANCAGVSRNYISYYCDIYNMRSLNLYK